MMVDLGGVWLRQRPAAASLRGQAMGLAWDVAVDHRSCIDGAAWEVQWVEVDQPVVCPAPRFNQCWSRGVGHIFVLLDKPAL
ncbi:hypothetical protein AU252_13035 [Pseudarthrobacter sulfonivorans]|uniref:Uncharacterized protein n=1 Tax=Pseudarthrobacter sulfonivorans TaxID=121292 RepID=A0A0U2XDI0_9MICC|nr:hypothetical protein AU252_13035 [Pseudarthrobacter sulfonivorans]